MSKERLEVIKEVYDIQAMQTLSDRETVPFNLNDIRWLVEQSERVQELEEELEKGETLLEKILPIYKRLKEQNKRYREALEFYADRKTYERRHDPYEPLDTDINNDRGEKARKVLEESE